MAGSSMQVSAGLLRTIAIVGLSLATAGLAQAPPSAPAPIGPLDPAEVEAFFDHLIGSQMEELHIAGVAVAVVRDGEPLLLKGYGHADLQNGVEVDPELTLFRIASITKTFTATAVMQLVEQGLVDLDTDVNTYLDFSIPATFGTPITMRHLLTHTAGFEDLFYDLIVLDEASMTPFREWMTSRMPARVRAPGVAAAYSNYGLSLAGYIVERVSGRPYAEYVRDNILLPLGMDRTTATSIWTPELEAAESKGYTYENGRFVLTPYYLGQPGETPAGGLLATASDMARYMLMHLQQGRLVASDGTVAQVLEPQSAQLMHATQHTPDARMLGTALGLFDFSDNGQRTLGHSGEAYPTSSLMLLLPDLGVGFFVVYNSDGSADLTSQHLGFQRAVYDHYFPTQAERAPAVGTGATQWAAVDASRFTGQYRLARGSYTTFEKVAVLFGTVNVTSGSAGILALDTPWGVFTFGAADPLYFRQTDGPFGLAFAEDPRGRVEYMFTDLVPMYSFDRLRWYETPSFNMALLAACLVLLLSVVVVGIVRLVGERRSHRVGESITPSTLSGEHRPARSVWAYWTLFAVAILAILFVAGVALFGDPAPLLGVSLGFKIVLALGVLAALLTVAALVANWFAWKEGYWRLTTRLHFTLGTLAAVGFVWFLNNWNLLGWRY